MNYLPVGRVSSGKSSFINSFVGYVSNVSLQRETIDISKYYFSNEGFLDNVGKLMSLLETKQIRSKVARDKNIMPPLEMVNYMDYPLPLRNKFKNNYNIYDFPGMEDANDTNDVFFSKFIELCSEIDSVIYVTDIQSAFRDTSEIELFTKIKNEIKKQKDLGNYIELLVVFNKYDVTDDDDYADIYNNSIKKDFLKDVNCFKYSSHAVFIDNIIKNQNGIIKVKNDFMMKEIKNKVLKSCSNIKTKIGDEYIKVEYTDDIKNEKIRGDHDNLILYLEKCKEKVYKKKSECIRNYFKNYIIENKKEEDLNEIRNKLKLDSEHTSKKEWSTFFTYLIIENFNNICYDCEVPILYVLLEYIVQDELISSDTKTVLLDNLITNIDLFSKYKYWTITPIYQYVIMNFNKDIHWHNYVLYKLLSSEESYENEDLIKLVMHSKNISSIIKNLLVMRTFDVRTLIYVQKTRYFANEYEIKKNERNYTPQQISNRFVRNLKYIDYKGLAGTSSFHHLFMEYIDLAHKKLETEIDECLGLQY